MQSIITDNASNMRKAFQVQFLTTVQEDEGEDSDGSDNHDTDEEDGSEDGEDDG